VCKVEAKNEEFFEDICLGLLIAVLSKKKTKNASIKYKI
jgi:hypothetical protein